MNLFRKFNFYANKKPPEEKLQEAFQIAMEDAKTKDIKSKTDSDLEMEFEDQYEKQIEKLLDQTYALILDESHTADQQVAGYKKAIAKFDQIKEFCDSKGTGGTLYYSNGIDEERELLIKDYKKFMQEEYNVLKQQEIEEVEYKLHCKRIKKQILQSISSKNGFLQKDLYSQFSIDDKSLVLRILKELIDSGKISKEKQGNTNLLRTIK